jgi:hypothetical protein
MQCRAAAVVAAANATAASVAAPGAAAPLKSEAPKSFVGSLSITMEWVASAEEYMGSFGWGARGKHLGVSRMFGEGDKASLSRNKWYAAARPRGILSGFLVILPNSGATAVYLPPIAAKIQPQRLRLRVSPAVASNGAVFSAYLMRGATGPDGTQAPRRLVLEDTLVWNGEPVWSTTSFKDRWNRITHAFVTEHFTADTRLQGFTFELAQYTPLAHAKEPDDRSVLEFVPDTGNQKRLIWMAPREAREPGVDATAAPQNTVRSSEIPALPTKVPEVALPAAAAPGVPPQGGFLVKKEAGMGPDVYAVYRGDARLGLALVRTLAVSKALRLAAGHEGATATVRADFNKTFDKYEILSVL